MEPPRPGKLQVQDRRRRQQTQTQRVDAPPTQDLARQEDVDRETCPLVATQHQRADYRRNDEVDKRVPRQAATEGEPTPGEVQRYEKKTRATQQHDGEQPESSRSSRSARGLRFHRNNRSVRRCYP